jgi:mycofactocin system glycosyltransferase
VIVVDDGSLQPVRIERGTPTSASVVRLDPPGGPAAARNAGWRLADSEIVVFLDADCVPVEGWLNTMLRHFADPGVAAVAPRIVSDSSSGTNLAEYEMLNSPLDRGPREAPVRPRSRVSYVPSACLAIRRRALVDLDGFNETLRFGEDVDLVWRLDRSGWSVRYEPAASVIHPPRPSLRSWLWQRFDYGGSAAQLAALHDRDVAPLDVSPWSAAAWMLAAAGHPIAAGMLVAGTSAALARRAGQDPETARELLGLALRGNLLAGPRIAEAIRRAWLPPAMLALALIPSGRTRRTSAAAVMMAFVLPLTDWAVRRPPVDAARWTALRIADDLAYQTGLWFGAAKKRSLKALLPRF